MLLIDGVKYELWTPKKEVEEFHPLVKAHYKEIFGNNSIFIEGNRLESESGKGSIPDGFVITLGEVPQWHIVEMELSTHQLYDHIVNQVGRFINGIKNTTTQKKIIEVIYHYTQENKQRKAELEESIGSGEIYKFLTDLITKPPILVIIIEKRTQELDEALDLLRYSPINILEFKTFQRVGAEAVHAHLFEPMYKAPPERIEDNGVIEDKKTETRKTGKFVTIKDLIDADILKVGQIIYRRGEKHKYEAKILKDGVIKTIPDGKEFPSPNAAIKYLTNGGSFDSWNFWKTTKEDGTECKLDEFREKYRASHPSII